MKSLLVAFIAVARSSCYTQKNGLQKGIDFDREVAATDVCFFGKFRYKTEGKTLHNRNAILLFRNDSLKYVASGKRKLKKYDTVFKVLYLSDSLTMLASVFQGRYFSVDTLLFSGDDCYWKRVDYHVRAYAETEIVHAGFEKYAFRGNELIYSLQTLFDQDSVRTKEPIKAYASRHGSKLPDRINHSDTTYVWQNYADPEAAKLRFFQSHF